MAEDQIPFRGLVTLLSSPNEPTEALSGSSSSRECNDFKEPKTEARFFCNDLRGGRAASRFGVDAFMAVDQAAASALAVPGRRRTFPLDFRPGLCDRPKNPELRRPFLRVSSEGARSWSGGRRSGTDVVETGLNILRLFLRSFFPVISAMARLRFGRTWSGRQMEQKARWRERAYLIDDPQRRSLQVTVSTRDPKPVWIQAGTAASNPESICRGWWEKRGTGLRTYSRASRRHEKQLTERR